MLTRPTRPRPSRSLGEPASDLTKKLINDGLRPKTARRPADHPLAIAQTADGAFVTPAVFWMVWNKNGAQPRATHATEAKARREAVRLAHANPGEKFIVLAATDKFWVAAPLAQAAE